MKTVGIVAEYDPLHWGHLYQMKKARELTDADCVVVVMGGDFLQRGTPCMIEKRVRARVAVDAGADLILALPYVFSVNSAREYASGAVRMLSGLGCVDYISFGCENGELSLLNRAVSVMRRENDLSPIIREKLRSGISWAEASTQAVDDLGGKELSSLLRHPNNLLACEYLRAIGEQGSALTPVPVRRVGWSMEDGPSEEKTEEPRYISASRIRSLINEYGVNAALPFVPEQTMTGLRESNEVHRFSGCLEVTDRRMFDLLKYRLLTADLSELGNVYSVGEGLENRLLTVIFDPGIRSVQSLARAVGTRRYTRSRIMRMLVHILMNFKEDDFAWLRETTCARVLASSKRGRKLLARMRKTAQIPVLSNLAGRERYDVRMRRLLDLEVRAAGLYAMLRGSGDLTGGEIRYVPYMP